METSIETLSAKKLVGMHKKMSRIEDGTGELWRSFMPRRGEVAQRTASEYISMQVYGRGDVVLDPATVFTKWAVVEVDEHVDIPDGMDVYTLDGGLYAIFIHHGPAAAFMKTMQFIYGEWLPDSGFELDQREHFEILPDNYSPMDPNAREEVCIPIRSAT